MTYVSKALSCASLAVQFSAQVASELATSPVSSSTATHLLRLNAKDSHLDLWLTVLGQAHNRR